MRTQHEPRVPPGVIAMISKESYLQIFRIIINFVYRAFLFLNPSAPDPKCKLSISSFLTLPHLLEEFCVHCIAIMNDGGME